MDTWSPITLYACACLAAALGGLAVHMRSDEPITARALLGKALYHGLIGGGLGAVGHESAWLKGRPATVVAIAALYGVGVLPISVLKGAVLRALNVGKPGANDE